MSTETPTVDRAAWARFSKSNKDRCWVCGHRGVVGIILTATVRGGTRGEAMAKQQFVFCDEHGRARFGAGLYALQNGGKVAGSGDPS